MIGVMLRLLPEELRPRLAGYAVLTVLSVLLRAAGIVVLVPLVTALLSPTPTDALGWLGLLTATTIAGWIVDAVVARIGMTLGFGTLDAAQRTVADRIAHVPLSWLTDDAVASARQAIAATGPDLVGVYVYLLSPVAHAVLLPVAIGVGLLPIAWQLGLVVLACVPLLLGALWATTAIVHAADRAAEAASTALTERIVEFARTQQALRAARRVEPERSHVGAALRAQHGATVRLLLLRVPGEVLFGVATQVALLLVAGTTAALTVDGALPVASAVALLVVLARFLEPFAALGDLAPTLESSTSILDRFRQVLDAPVPADAHAPASRAWRPAPAVELRDVTLRYPGADAPALEGLSVRFEPGSTTAIVGPSGSGKTSILSLVAGLVEPAAGAVRIDDVALAGLSPADRHAASTVVLQHPYLFEGTIRDNVLAGDPSADADRLERAIALARVDEIARRVPGGLDGGVGEGGTSLSGGERQRVSIARALLKPAPVLLVDEATSALDAENEAAVVAALSAAAARTSIVVAHRLTTIRSADRVLFVDGGRIVEDGAPDALLARDGRFSAFWRQQQEAAGWRLERSA